MEKLLFFDIDGTLAYPGCDPSPATAAAITAARNSGHLAFLSTGRTTDSVPEGVRRIGFDGGIFSAGGIVLLGDQILACHYMHKEILARVLDVLAKLPVYFELETLDGRFHSGNGETVLAQAALSRASRDMAELCVQLLTASDARPMTDYQGQQVFKIAYYCAEESTAARLTAALAECANVVPFDNLPGLLLSVGEISDPAVNKGRALEDLCAHFGKTPADCIAFGDSMNDAEILRAAGLGIAMGNAVPELKALARQVCDRCENDGISKALRELDLL